MPNQRETLQNLLVAYQQYRDKAGLSVQEAIARMREEQARIAKEAERARREREQAG